MLARTSARHHTPTWAILSTAAAAFALSVTGTFTYLITLNVTSRLLVFICTAVALIRFRRQRSAPPAQFMVPGGITFACISGAACQWLLTSSGARELRDVAIALAFGALVFALHRAVSARTGRDGRDDGGNSQRRGCIEHDRGEGRELREGSPLPGYRCHGSIFTCSDLDEWCPKHALILRRLPAG